MPRHFLAFATNFKNENPYLAEWIAYHRMVGVDHFYLYDQDGGEAAKAILAPYERLGLVTRHPWTHYNNTRYDRPTRFYQKDKNHLAFAHCARNHRSRFRWVMKIDVDEFLFPADGGDSLIPWLETVDPCRVKGIRIPRYDFGDNGHDRSPALPVIEAFTRREKTASNHKDMASGRFLSSNRFCYSAHWWRYNLLKPGRFLKDPAAVGLRINHYYTKSREEYFQRQNVNRSRRITEERFQAVNQRANALEDRGMLRFVPGVKQALAARQTAGDRHCPPRTASAGGAP